MLSSTDFDPVAIAIQICNNSAFKTEIFSVPYTDQETPEECKKNWDEKVETIAVTLLEDYTNLETNQQKTVIGAVFSIALRMLTWIEFYAGTFNFSRDFCIGFLDTNLFTSKGIIDPEGVEAKMSEKEYDSLRQFQLASFYCQWMEIPRLFNSLSTEEKNLVYNANNPELITQPDIIKFWSYYAMGELDKLRGDTKIDQFRLKSAITSGSQLGVNYCLGKTKWKQSNVVDTVVSIFSHRMHRELRTDENLNIVDDWIAFGNKRYRSTEESWIPNNFFVDIFYSLLTDMTEYQKTDFWRQITHSRFLVAGKRSKSFPYALVLEYLLCWPYQEMFLELLKSSWQHISVAKYSCLLLKIFNRIEPKSGQFWYGEEKVCDYRKILMEAWSAGPACTKYILFQRFGQDVCVLLKSLYSLKTFTERDRRQIKSIVESVTRTERKNFLLDKGYKICTMLLERKRLDLYNELIYICLSSSEQVQEYKIKVIHMYAKEKCLKLIKSEKWDEAEESLKWSGLEINEEEMRRLKKILIYHVDGMKMCLDLWKDDSNVAEDFVHWCAPSEELPFKKILLYSQNAMIYCTELCLTQPELADNFVSWCCPSEPLTKLKTSLINQKNFISSITNMLYENRPELADKLVQWFLPNENIKIFKKMAGFNYIRCTPCYTFDGIYTRPDDEFPDQLFDWNPVQNLFHWCFDSDPVLVSIYKQNNLKRYTDNILRECIKTNNWLVAEKFLFWLNLDNDSLRMVKKKLFCEDFEIGFILFKLLSRQESDSEFSLFGGKQQTIEHFIHWFLVDDVDIVKEMINKLECYSDESSIQNIIFKLKACYRLN